MSSLISAHHQIPERLWHRHGHTIFRYNSPQKMLNAVQAMGHYALGKTEVSTMPLFLKVELSRHCTIQCSGCSFPKDYRFYPFDRFRSLLDAFAPYIFMAQLYEIGEPLHHPQILECIDYAHNRKVGTVISSSLSLKKPDLFWKRLAASGLDRLIVAIDGTTSPTYNQYRTKGDLSLVMDNLKRILQYRSQQRSDLFVEWQMIDFPWNRCEQDSARELATVLGCDDFRIITDASQFRHPEQPISKGRRKRCLWPYLVLLVNVYEDVIPCFKPGCRPGVLGNLTQSSFGEIWNGDEIRRIRSNSKIRSRIGCRACVE